MSTAYTYDHIVATGGIGTGLFFEMTGNETLGREESRMAKLLPYKDYCKQHIILHYISVLLGASENRFHSYAIGGVGNDQPGTTLLEEMKKAGIDTGHVKIMDRESTLFSVCYQYPDHTGGNITTSESASSKVSAADIDGFFTDFHQKGKELILAAPEVPVETRIRLLQHGRERSSVNISSIASGEVHEFKNQKGFELTDMLFINLDEARTIADISENASVETIVLAAIRDVIKINADLTVFVTCGAAGVYCYHKKHFEFTSAKPVTVVSTAGAGDAFLAGTLAGICRGMPVFNFKNTQVKTAVDLGIALAAAAVTSPHTINPDINESILTNF